MSASLSPLNIPALVGRDRECWVLRECLDAALAGHGRLVLISGEAGIGKTTLAEDLCRVAVAHGALILVGRAYDLAETPPYGPWAEALARLTRRDLPPAPDLAGGRSAGSQAALFATVCDFLAVLAAQQPLVLLLDDLHWADPASLDLLRVVGRRLAALPLLLLATYRVEEVTASDPLAAALPLLVREARPSRLDLRGLGTTDVRAWLDGRYRLAPGDATRLADYLQERAEGNPLYTGEILRTFEAEGLLRQDGNASICGLGDLSRARVPTLLRQIIGARVSRLGAGTARLLAVAAVIGQEVPLALWAAVAGTTEEALLVTAERAIDARILNDAPGGDTVRFAHALMREALYEGTSALHRRTWHRAAGEALAAMPDPDPDAVAYHFRRGGDGRAARWLLRAGERAERACAWLTAAERFEAALAAPATSETADEERAWLLLRLARLRRYHDTPRALVHLEEGARLGDALGDQALRASARFHRGLLYWFVGDYVRGGADLEAGVAAIERLPAGARARALQRGGGGEGGHIGTHYATLAAFLAEVGRYRDALDMGGRALRRADDHPSGGPGDHALADAYLAAGLTHAAQGRPDEAHHAYARARAAYRAGGNHYLAAMTLAEELLWVALPYRPENVAARRRLAAEAERTLAAAQTIRADFPPRLARLPLLFLEGAWGEVRALAFENEEVPSGETFINLGVLGALAAAAGEVARGWQIVEVALPAGADAMPGTAILTTALALQRVAVALSLHTGDLARARAWLEAHDRWLAWSGAVLGQVEGQLGWAAYHRAGGDLHRAREHAGDALTRAAAPRQPLALLAAHRALGELNIAAGRHAEATAHLHAALALADACAVPYERALTLLALAELRLAADDYGGAATALAEAHARLDTLGAAPALARAEALAAGLPQTVVRQGRPAALTAREVEVLRLVAAGASNREMAAILGRSERTVERHLENLYRKIGARNRADATAFALRANLT